jgi:hypothetical protein
VLLDPRHDKVHGGVGTGQQAGHGEEPVHLPGEPLLQHRHAGLHQLGGVEFALVAQDVVLGREDDRGGQPQQVRAAQRGGVGVDAGGGVGNVVVPEPDHGVPAEHELVGGVGVRSGVQVTVGDGVGEHLYRDGRPARRLCALRHDRGEVAAGAVAGDDQRHRAVGQLGQVRGRPAQRRPRVVHSGREAVLRGEPVVHHDHHAARPQRELAAERVEAV